MRISNVTKTQLRNRLVKHYGEDFKTPLAKDLGVDVRTVRRMFNDDKGLSKMAVIAINCILEHKTHENRKRPTTRD